MTITRTPAATASRAFSSIARTTSSGSAEGAGGPDQHGDGDGGPERGHPRLDVAGARLPDGIDDPAAVLERTAHARRRVASRLERRPQVVRDRRRIPARERPGAAGR